MKKQICLVMMFMLSWPAISAISATPLQAEELKSLRGSRDLQEVSQEPESNKLITDQRPIKRDFVQQPPLIPHSIENYTTTRRYNKCLSCHSWANYKSAGATKISPTHFVDREGNELANLSPIRYFCTQCHVVQTDNDPLVENTFEGVPAMKQ